MIIIFSLLLCVVFMILALIHFNWFFGGKFGFSESLPTKENGVRVLNPKKTESAIVGIGLLVFSLFYLLKSGLIQVHLPNWIILYLGWIISIIFLLRAIGEFKYVGFFKKIKNTKFGKLDTKLFSPLCLGISIIGVLIEIIS